MSQVIRLIAFPGVHNLPLIAGESQGFFERRGLKIESRITPNSQELRDALSRGEFDIAQAVVDNAVAMVEGTGADVVIVMGGDTGMSELFVQPEIASAAELRGRTVIVDAPNTAFALQLKKWLLLDGLVADRDYVVKSVGSTAQRVVAMRDHRDFAATMLSPPYSIIAQRDGLRSLGAASDRLGPYQAVGTFALRAWASANADRLQQYIAASVEALRWALSPANRAAAAALLAERLSLDPEVAASTYAAAADPQRGLTVDVRFSLEGFRNALALRAEIEGQWGGHAPDPARYYDLSYYQRALAAL
jgi:ABC-type nitrate/sulfonate/bicarbonate transport system substrate-binding protein